MPIQKSPKDKTSNAKPGTLIAWKKITSILFKFVSGANTEVVAIAHSPGKDVDTGKRIIFVENPDQVAQTYSEVGESLHGPLSDVFDKLDGIEKAPPADLPVGEITDVQLGEAG